MRIGIDARLLSQTGVGRYIRNLLSSLAEIDRQDEFYIFLRKRDAANLPELPASFKTVYTEIPWHTFEEQLRLPVILFRYRLDAVHFPYFSIPVFYPGRFIMTVHDLIVDHFDTGKASRWPLPLYRLKRWGYHLLMKVAVARAKKILAISESTAKEIYQHYPNSQGKTVITYDALDLNFQRKAKMGGIRRPKEFTDLKYLLYVGNAYPHKNLDSLISIYSEIYRRDRVKLVLVGDDDYFYPQLKSKVRNLNLQNCILFYGQAKDKELAGLYRFSEGLINPSLMEGFGLPLLEAVSIGCLPVVSDIASFREIWGDSLIYFDPENRQSIQEAIIRLLTLSAAEKTKRLKVAQNHAGKYSWKKTAQTTLWQYRHIK